MGLLNLLLQDPVTFVLLAVPLLYSIILHELAHGWVAWRMGDPTAKWLGRLTLNPLKHLDPLGTAMLFLFGFGWAKPVPVNLGNIPDTRRGLILVSSAGIIANMIVAFLAMLVWRILAPPSQSHLAQILYYLAQINIMLASFNLIPIPPLDGSKILMGFSSAGFRHTLSRIEPYGFFIIIGLLYLGILNPVIAFFRWLILALLGILLP
ncbi:Zn-dependent protease (includes SpoIVFB) [Syntrophus gentianae]|uniref:Zn-dependent protease (Includes SpoIVFB) n=1 Tax=Syntrophus gentianae TaxID=43775 RepID=A0A1H7Y4I4_9BACT|nr:site-2 protease family protein [Syntrophus gentianae]SEM40883.1 Zn-dependent protease (includes SpoIVFB) [Syntrophus gentianae]